MPTEKEVIAELRDTLQQYEEFVEKLKNTPHGYCVISHIVGDKVYLTSIGGARTVASKKYLVITDLQVGDWFEATNDADVPFAKLEGVTAGRKAEVVSVNECTATVKLGEQTVEVPFNPSLALKGGDTVRVDPHATVVTAVLERAKQKAADVLDRRIDWTDVGGQAEAKIELIEAIELPLKHPEVYARYNKRAPKGVLMFGPPGCGKTLLGRAVASALVRDSEHPGCFMYVKGPELLNPYVGVSESNIRDLFARARAYKAEHHAPAVVFIDEADALLGARGNSHGWTINDSVVPQFLAEMDGLNESDVMVILATNRPDTLDPAVVRDGRVDRKIRVGRPTQKDATAIFKLYLARVPLASGSIEELAESIAHDLYTIERNLYELKLDDGSTTVFGLTHLVSGALIEGVVEKATALAIRRELTDPAGAKGLTLADLTRAVDAVYRQNLDLNHHDAMEDFAVPRAIKSARKLAHAA